MLGLAARVWQRAVLAPAATTALRKLETTPGAPPASLPAQVGVAARVGGPDAALLPMLTSVRERRAVAFAYRGRIARLDRRHLEPWGVVSWRGRWYVVGHDRDRAETRVFRLSRVVGTVRGVGPSDAYAVPAGTQVRELVARRTTQESPVHARVRARVGAANALRREAVSVTPDGAGWDVLELADVDEQRLATEVAGLAGAAVVLEPAQMRADVRARLGAVLAAHPPASSDRA